MRVLPLGKGEHHEGRPEQNFRQEIYAGRISPLYGGLILYNENILIKKEIFMKKQIFLFLSITTLAACASLQPIDWRGQNFDNYVSSKGVPSSQYTLQNGNTIYSYKTTCQYDPMKTGETLITVGPNNLIVNISNTTACPSYYDSPEYKIKQEIERKKESNEKKIKDLETTLKGAETNISLLRTMIQSAQTDIEFAKMKKDDAALSQAEQKLKKRQEELKIEEEYKAKWEAELKQLKQNQYR